MGFPTKYVPSYSFTSFQTGNPSTPLPAPRVDEQFNNIATSLSMTIDALSDVRRSDGKLKNGIVTADSLNTALNMGFAPLGAWLLGASYGAGDGVVFEQNFYTCRVSHVATNLNRPDVDSATWLFAFAVSDLVVDGALSFPSVTYTGDGATTVFALPAAPVSVNNLWAKVGTVVQSVSAYTVSGASVTMNAAPGIGIPIEFRVLATIGVVELEEAVYAARDTAIAKAGEASDSADAAETSAENADNSAAGAFDSKNAAAASATGAVSARNAAYSWSSAAEDIPVDDGVNPSGFSAFHWAQKALAYVGSALGAQIHAAPAKIALADADEFGIWNSVSGSLGKVTWASIRASGIQPQGRLSLASGVPLSESDIVGGVNVYYVPSGGLYLPVYDGSVFLAKAIGSQLTLALDSNSGHAGYHQTGRNFDLFGIVDAGSPKLGTGPSWNAGAVAGSDIARGTGAGSTELETFNGLLVNKNAIVIRIGSATGDTVSVPARQATYLGSFRATANGQASDTKTQRLLFNAYNVAVRRMFTGGAAASYAYSAAVWQSLAGTGLKCEFLLGLSGTTVKANGTAMAWNSTATPRVIRCGIGLDSLTAISDGALSTSVHVVAGVLSTLNAFYEDTPGLGYHYLAQLEMGAGADTQTWFAYLAGSYRSGMIVSYLG